LLYAQNYSGMIIQLLVIAILCLGFFIYIKIANQNKSDKINGFFLGGRNINNSLFQHATWGTSFALNNGIYWGIYFGYTAGISALWINCSWALGFFALSYLIKKLVVPTSKFTIHGYLGSIYGGKTRIIASIATATALVLNLGSEIVFASLFLAKILGVANIEIILVFMFSVFGASYCSIGGYRANAAIDRFQNLVSVFTMLLIVTLLSSFHATVDIIKIILFCIGAIGFFFFVRDNLKTNRDNTKLQNLILFISGLLFILAFSFSDTFKTNEIFNRNIFTSLSDTKFYTSDYILSLMVFQFFYQFVDTVNWQNISAHNISIQEGNKVKGLRSALKNSSVKIMIAPIFISTIIGIMFSTIYPVMKSSESGFMYDLVYMIIPKGNDVISGLLLGLISFGLIGAGLSGIDSWLMATSQTFSWDIFEHKKFKEKYFNVSNFTESEEKSLTNRAKSLLFVLTLLGAFLYYVFYKASEGKIVVLFFVIFSSSLSLLPSLLFGLFFTDKANKLNLRLTSSMSILLGFLTPLLLVAYSFYYPVLNLGFITLTNDSFYTYGPFFAIGISIFVFSLGILLTTITPKTV
jgi:hypothetical protein